MADEGTPKAAVAGRPTNRDATAPHSAGASGGLTLTPTNIHTQIAGGAAVDETSGFTVPSPGHTVQIVLGASGANPTVYTVTGTWRGHTVTEDITAAGAGTYEGTQPFETITALESDVDPVGTTDLQTLDIWFPDRCRGVWVGGAGVLSGRLTEDSTDGLWSGIPAGTMLPLELQMVRCDKTGRSGIEETTATLIESGR